VARFLETAAVEPGREVFREGDAADAVIVVLEGQLRLDSRERGAAGGVGPGAVLGAFALVGAGPRELSACAVGPARIAILSRGAYRRLLREEPRAAALLLAALVGDFAESLRAALD
jgi:CRP-like cAMP-binding protein